MNEPAINITEGAVLEGPHWTEPVRVLSAKVRASRVEVHAIGVHTRQHSAKLIPLSPYGEWDPDDEWGVHNDECWQCEGPYWEICDDADWQNQTCPDPQCQWRYDPTWEMSWCFRYIDRGFTYMPPMSLGLSL